MQDIAQEEPSTLTLDQSLLEYFGPGLINWLHLGFLSDAGVSATWGMNCLRILS